MLGGLLMLIGLVLSVLGETLFAPPEVVEIWEGSEEVEGEREAATPVVNASNPTDGVGLGSGEIGVALGRVGDWGVGVAL